MLNFSNNFRDKEGVPKFNVGLLPPAVPRTLKLLCVLKVLGKVKQRAKYQHRIFMHHVVMGIYISHRLISLREYASVNISRDKIGSTA